MIFHWEREAARFAPKLRTKTFVGTGRFQNLADDVASGFADHDLVITTYGSLRNDVPKLDHIEWNYVILDEAQAIKNERSQISKAVRLLHAKHRLALSGTPIENHLGELWSLMEFLNPGMLGASRTFQSLLRAAPPSGDDEDDSKDDRFVTVLRRAVRPFLLRRTKAQVLTDLPEKSEQILECELPPAQRKVLRRPRGPFSRAAPRRPGR